MQPVFLLDLEIQSHFFGGLLTEQSQLWPLQLQLLAQASFLLYDYDSDQQMNQFFDHRSVNYQGFLAKISSQCWGPASIEF